MKKQGLLSFILTLVGTMWIATAEAQTKYNLKIAGMEVTSANWVTISRTNANPDLPVRK